MKPSLVLASKLHPPLSMSPQESQRLLSRLKASLKPSLVLASKLHPPLPMSPRESQRLLSLLNASFKQQLDREHSAHSSNDLHLQSILMDPLFDAKPRTPAFSPNERQNNVKLLEQLRNQMIRPMDAFKERVSQGTADLETAMFFLRIQHEYCLTKEASSAATLREAMQSTGVASIILQWLWSSGMEDSGDFLKSKEFIGLLVPFLVAEDQHSHILRWLHKCAELGERQFSSQPILDTYHVKDMKAFILTNLIDEEKKIGGLESAIALFCRTISDLRSSGWTMTSMRSSSYWAARLLISAIRRLPKVAEPERRIIRQFSATMRNLNTGPLLSATLDVFVHEKPDPQAVLTYFQHHLPNAKVPLTFNKRRQVIELGFRAADLFLQDSRQTEALRIMEFLQANFAPELGSLQPQTRRLCVSDDAKEVSRREEESLHLLDTLTV